MTFCLEGDKSLEQAEDKLNDEIRSLDLGITTGAFYEFSDQA